VVVSDSLAVESLAPLEVSAESVEVEAQSWVPHSDTGFLGILCSLA
jgi:hypothetical protein